MLVGWNPEQAAHRRRVRHLRQIRRQLFDRRREHAAAIRHGTRSNLHPAPRARHPPRRILQPHRIRPHGRCRHTETAVASRPFATAAAALVENDLPPCSPRCLAPPGRARDPPSHGRPTGQSWSPPPDVRPFGGRWRRPTDAVGFRRRAPSESTNRPRRARRCPSCGSEGRWSTGAPRLERLGGGLLESAAFELAGQAPGHTPLTNGICHHVGRGPASVNRRAMGVGRSCIEATSVVGTEPGVYAGICSYRSPNKARI